MHTKCVKSWFCGIFVFFSSVELFFTVHASEWELLWRDWCNKLSFEHGFEWVFLSNSAHMWREAYRLSLRLMLDSKIPPWDSQQCTETKRRDKEELDSMLQIYIKSTQLSPIMFRNCFHTKITSRKFINKMVWSCCWPFLASLERAQTSESRNGNSTKLWFLKSFVERGEMFMIWNLKAVT